MNCCEGSCHTLRLISVIYKLSLTKLQYMKPASTFSRYIGYKRTFKRLIGLLKILNIFNLVKFVAPNYKVINIIIGFM